MKFPTLAWLVIGTLFVLYIVRPRPMLRLTGYVLLCTAIMALTSAVAGYFVWKAFFYYINHLDVAPPVGKPPTPGMGLSIFLAAVRSRTQ